MKLLLNKYSLILLSVFLFGSTYLSAQNEGSLTIQKSESIKHIIAKKKAYNKSLKKVKGYRIQIFFGSENGAYKTRDKFRATFPKPFLKIQNFPPDWKVRVGNYKTRLEADRELVDIKKIFPGAIVLSEMINI
ncbi:MAG TPA: hypothetical protein DDZ39_07780 [Flavobacteriaceae bacterium]|jgi:hypothetical protein|nr:hypothetical protein [Flavobacteriaceae bacterium]